MKDNNLTVDDCWNTMGVWRTGTTVCPKLEEVIHCRNCTSYINSGLQLLNRHYPDGYCNENTETYKQEIEASDSDSESLIIFRIANDWYAMPTGIFVEIDTYKAAHNIPHNQNNFIEGLVNIRGELELCISLSALLEINNLPESEEAKSRLIIIKLDSGKYAIKTEQILGVNKIRSDTINQPPASITHTSERMITGIFEYDGKHIGIIDDQLLDNRLGVLRQ